MAPDAAVLAFDDVIATRERIKPHTHRTLVSTLVCLKDLAGTDLFFECGNLQKAGTFKVVACQKCRGPFLG